MDTTILATHITTYDLDALRDEFSRLSLLYSRRNSDFQRAAAVVYGGNELEQRLRSSLDTITWLDDFVLRLATPWTLLNRYTALMTSGTPIIRITGLRETAEGDQIAAALEAMLRRYRVVTNRAYRAAGRSYSLDADRARYLFVYGHCYQVLSVNPANPELPVWTDVWDPSDVYPVWGPDGIVRCYTKLRLSVEQARRQWGPHCYPDAQPDEMRTVIWYCDEQACLAFDDNGTVLMPPMPHGVPGCPVIASFANGETGRPFSTDSDSYQLSAMGRSALWPVLSELETFAKLTEAAVYATVLNAVPPIKRKRGMNALPFDVDLSPGGITDLDDTADVQYLVNPAALPGLQALLEQIWRRIQAHVFTIDPVSIREQIPSGFAADIANKAERVYFYAQYADALRSHIERECVTVLHIVRRYASPATIIERLPSGAEAAYAVDPLRIPERLDVSVTLRMLSLPDILQLAVVGAQATGGPVISAETFQRDILLLDDPHLERQRMNVEASDRSPLSIKALQPGHDLIRLRRLAADARARGAADEAVVWEQLALVAEHALTQAVTAAVTSAITGTPPAEEPPRAPAVSAMRDPDELLGEQPVMPPDAPPGQRPGIAPNVAPPEQLANPNAEPFLQRLREALLRPEDLR